MDAGPIVIFERTSRKLDRTGLRAFARSLSTDLAQGRDFCCLLSGDACLQRLNREFLGKDHSTDVLSFPARPGESSLGDIAISVPRAAAQAASLGHDADAELRVLMLHGILHLLGYDHDSDRGRMRRTETRWRKHYRLPLGLIERAGP